MPLFVLPDAQEHISLRMDPRCAGSGEFVIQLASWSKRADAWEPGRALLIDDGIAGPTCDGDGYMLHPE